MSSRERKVFVALSLEGDISLLCHILLISSKLLDPAQTQGTCTGA